MRARSIGAGIAAAFVLAACTHDRTSEADRGGEPVGVNSVKSSPVTGSVTGAIQPSPSAMATTGPSGPTVR